MNVLLTGGMGYIGSHSAVVLSELGHQVVLYDNLSNSSDTVHGNLEHITGQRIRA
jgi:UDP-glucose 4-epimerase